MYQRLHSGPKAANQLKPSKPIPRENSEFKSPTLTNYLSIKDVYIKIDLGPRYLMGFWGFGVLG